MSKSIKNEIPWTKIVEKWLVQADKAYRNGYYFETIGICFNVINHLLRKGILVQIESGSASENNYARELFEDENNPIVGKIPDRSLYREAVRLSLIPSDKELQKLHEDRNELFHKLLFTYTDSRSKSEIALLKKLAARYLNITVFCLFNLVLSQLKSNASLVEKLKEAGAIDAAKKFEERHDIVAKEVKKRLDRYIKPKKTYE